MRVLCASLFALAVAGSAAAQYSETIEVRVNNVDVVVTDRHGKAVAGLTRDDFQIFEDGNPQKITNFYEVRPDAPPAWEADGRVVAAESRRRSVAIFLDESSIGYKERNDAIAAARESLSRLIRPGDDATLVDWNVTGEWTIPFTGDATSVAAALADAEKRMSGGSNLATSAAAVLNSAADALKRVSGGGAGGGHAMTKITYTVEQAYDDAVAAWRMYAEHERMTQRRMLAAVNRTVARLGGTEGRKVLVFVSGRLQERPGLPVMREINRMFGRARPVIPAEAVDPTIILSDELRRVARRAAASSVTLYLLDVSPGNTQEDTYLSMGELASATGGTVMSGSRNYDLAFGGIARDLGAYYSLGYKPSPQGPAERKLAVKVSRPGLTVRSREMFALKTAADDTADDLVANAFHEPKKSELNVTLTVGAITRGGRGKYSVPVTVTFPGDLTYLPEGPELTGGFTVSFLTATDDGSTSEVGQESKDVRFAAAQYEEITAKPFTYTATLMVGKGRQELSVSVADRVDGRTGYAKTTIDAR